MEPSIDYMERMTDYQTNWSITKPTSQNDSSDYIILRRQARKEMTQQIQQERLELATVRENHALEIRRSSRDGYLWMKRITHIIQPGTYRPSYLQYRTTVEQQLTIMESLTGDLPKKLPPLSLLTASLYRRSNRPFFYGKPDDHPHLISQSLLMLAVVQNSLYDNIEEIVNCFQRNLQCYLRSQWWEVREYAIMVAGNKLFGHSQTIKKLINEPRYLWVVFNFIQDGQIGFDCLTPKILAGDTDCLHCLCQVMHCQERERPVFLYLLENQYLLEYIIGQVELSSSTIVSKLCVQAIGILLSNSDEELVEKLLEKFNVLQAIYKAFFLPNEETRNLGCWALSNLSSHSPIWNRNIFECEEVMSRLIQMLNCDTPTAKIKILTLLNDLMNQDNLQLRAITDFVKNNKLLQTVCHLCLEEDCPELQLAALNTLQYVYEFESEEYQISFRIQVRSRGIIDKIELLSYNQNLSEESYEQIETFLRKFGRDDQQ